VHVQPLPHWILLFFLGGIFLHFLLAGGRTFYSSYREGEPAAWIAEIAFIICGTATVWFLGLHRQIPLPNGLAAAVLLLASLVLYEWARHTIWGRRFGLGWGTHVPDALCEAGPYRRVRHPIYLAYMLAYLAAFVALPHWLTAATSAAGIALFTHAAHSDEVGIATSAIAADYAAYRDRAGMFWPKLSRARPDR
jgi:protein-S-isoprenylcysteine O-methyltransferase Ste14